MTRRIFCTVLLAVVATLGLLALSDVLSAQGRSEDALERVKEVQARHTDELLAKNGVVGTAVGLGDNGRHVVMVLLEGPDVAGIPQELDGIPVKKMVTGKIYAQQIPPKRPRGLTATASGETQIKLSWRASPGAGITYNVYRSLTSGSGYGFVNSTSVAKYLDTALEPGTTYYYVVTAQNSAGESGYSNEASATTLGGPPIGPRPAPIGISTGHPKITAGTISCRVTKEGNVYALSNNHVYANENRASIGDNVLQPGPYDGGQNPRDAIGTLADFEPINFSGGNNTIDAAIALSSTANLDKSTPPDGYGTPSSSPVAASLGLRVQKYGRTTTLTSGKITGINATVDVGYSTGVARFVNQILVAPAGFSAPGDSGSLIVTQNSDPAEDKRPVGLLFAGSSTITVANPIDAVLTRFGVTVDGE